jgi:hypothetical protein
LVSGATEEEGEEEKEEKEGRGGEVSSMIT